MSVRRSRETTSEKHGKPRSREEAIPEMQCVAHEQQELSSRVERYKHTPQSAFCLPTSAHHWLICQNHAGPRKFLVQTDNQEHDVSGLNNQQIIYLPPGTRTQWDFSPAEGSTHLLIPDKLLLQVLSNERAFAGIQERGPLMGALMPTLSQFINSSSNRVNSEQDFSHLALSEFILEAAQMLTHELSVQEGKGRSETRFGDHLSAEALQILKGFMWDNIERNITLAELARLVHLSPFHFSRIFKEKTQTSPHQALLRMRVRKARSLLPHSRTLTEIAYCCGFSDQAHFTRVFKAQTGFTPKQFRKATA